MNSNVVNDLEIFKNLSSKEDYMLITSENIKYNDYERLSFITYRMGLMSLNIYLFNKHHHKYELQHMLREILEAECESYIDVDILDNWLTSFIENIKDNSKKDYAKKLLNI